MSGLIVTVDAVMELEPCEEYPRTRVQELFGDGLTLLEISGLDIPVEDRLWVLPQLLPPREARLFACACAQAVLPLFERESPDDTRPRDAIDVARRFAHGEATQAELAASSAAASAAAWDASRDASRDAARAASWAASWDAARAASCAASRNAAWAASRAASSAASSAASRDAASAASWDAAWDAAWDAELKWLVARLKDGKWDEEMVLVKDKS